MFEDHESAIFAAFDRGAEGLVQEGGLQDQGAAAEELYGPKEDAYALLEGGGGSREG